MKDRSRGALFGLGASVVLVCAAGLGFGAPAPAEPSADAGGDACVDCHVGIETDTTVFGALPFLHAPHVSLERGCLRCHNQHVGGEEAGVTVARRDCRACHHMAARRGAALCERCHYGIYERPTDLGGRPFPHSVHVGAFTGLGCDDCHGAAAEEVVASPAASACIACHP